MVKDVKVKSFDYSTWPIVSYGNSIKPIAMSGQWSAYISAGGQNDAIVVNASSKENVLELRKYLLKGFEDRENLLEQIEKQKKIINILTKGLKSVEKANIKDDSPQTIKTIYETWLKLDKIS
jgi:hypothetical protein